MPVESSENFSGRTLIPSVNGDWRANRVWLVTGAVDEGQLFSATAIDGSPIAGLGNSHPQNSKLKVESYSISKTGPSAWSVVANYAIPPNERLSESDEDLLTRKILIQWRKGNYSIPVDRDIKALPIANSAGDPFDPPQSMVYRTRHLRIVRYEPFFNLANSALFEDRVNSNVFVVGPLVIDKGECLCESIEPIEDYTTDAVAIPIAYDFEIRRLIINNKRVPPYRLYLKDVGRRGWYTESGTTKSGEFVNADGTQVTTDIPLDGTGKPIDSTIKVGSGKATPVAAPGTVSKAPVVSELSNSFVKVLGWDMLYEADFSKIGL